MYLNINTDAVVVFTNKLEKMKKSALPNAIRGALNKAAFFTKQDSLLKSAKATFVEREKNFFKANSRVQMAKGDSIKSMKSVIGMTSQGLKGSNNYAVKDLEKQEHGGSIEGRSFVPMPKARVGNSNVKRVRPAYRVSAITNIVSPKKVDGKNQKERFVKAAYRAGAGGYVLGEGKNGRHILWRIESIHSSLRTKKTTIRKTPLYSFVSGRSARVSPTGFMQKAALVSGRKIEEFFILEAKRQFEKMKK